MNIKKKKLLEDTIYQQSNVATRYWIKIIDKRRELYGVNGRMKLKRTMIKPGLFDYRDAGILFEENLTITGTGAIQRNK